MNANTVTIELTEREYEQIQENIDEIRRMSSCLLTYDCTDNIKHILIAGKLRGGL